MFLCKNDVQTLSKKSHCPTLMLREAVNRRKQRAAFILSLKILSLKCTKFDRNGQREKFGQLIFRRIIEIVATRRQILSLKCTKFDFGWGSTPDPVGAPPQTLG